MKKTIITTSWDDGHKLDLKLINLLNQYNLKGTFYISKKYELKSLNDKEIKQMAKSQEIGAHTLSHSDLRRIDFDQAKKEIFGSKEYLKNLLKKEIKMFCYPSGFYEDEIKKLVEQAGFLGSRTTKEFCFKKPEDFFEFGTTLHVYPFPFRKIDANHYHLTRFLFQPLSRNFFEILKIGLPFNSFFSWLNLAKNLFDYVYKNGGIYHLWGHSWEIDKYDMWVDLENMFKYIRGHKDIIILTNSEVLEKI